MVEVVVVDQWCTWGRGGGVVEKVVVGDMC